MCNDVRQIQSSWAMSSTRRQAGQTPSAPHVPPSDGFTWSVLDGARLPCIIRQGRQYVPYRVLERQLLIGLGNKQTRITERLLQKPMHDGPLSAAEAGALTTNAGTLYGSFNCQDVAIWLDEFRTVYNDMKTGVETANGGWLQVNNR